VSGLPVPVLAPFPWRQTMGFGLGVMRLSPEAFWRMTPRELSAAIRAVTGERSPLTRATFDELLKRFPDDGSQRG
jgi:uncharacterized phage protein (TIGR02216 family)